MTAARVNSETEGAPRARRGHRPKATSTAEIARVGLALFLERGYDEVTVKDIAESVGVSVRTVFRYFPTKADIAWGAFEQGMQKMTAFLDEVPEEVSTADALLAVTLNSNVFLEDELDVHRERMRLILRSVEAGGILATSESGSMSIQAAFVARRLGVPVTDVAPQTVARAVDSLVRAVYEYWLDHPEADLETLFRDAFASLKSTFGGLS